MSWQKKAHVAAVVIIVLLFALILRSVNLARLWHAFAGVVWLWVGSVFLLNVLNTWVEAARWRLILGSVKPGARLSNTFAALLVGVLGNSVLPLRLGDGARAYFLARREKVRLASSLATVMLDRVVDVTFFLVMVVITGFYFHLPLLIRRGGILGGLALGGTLIALLALMRFGPSLHVRFNGKLGQKFIGQIHRFTLGLSSLKSAGVLLPASALSTLSWGLRLVMVLSIFRAFHFDLPFIAAAVVLIFSNLGIAAVSTPANLGGFELSTLAALKLFGVETELAVSCALVLHMVEVIPMVILGLVVLWSSGLKSSELFRRAASP
jgi:uncharacterized protein (TIRG00374 family)